MADLVDLTVDECLALLSRHTLGRLALMTRAGLRILPLNYALDHDDTIVFRTLPDGVIAASAHGAEVAFEVDRLDEDTHTGWSVEAVGRCERMEDPGDVRFMTAQGDAVPWAPGDRVLHFRIRWFDLTGRQVGMAGRPSLIPDRRS
jgi:hypothetical protein